MNAPINQDTPTPDAPPAGGLVKLDGRTYTRHDLGQVPADYQHQPGTRLYDGMMWVNAPGDDPDRVTAFFKEGVDGESLPEVYYRVARHEFVSDRSKWRTRADDEAAAQDASAESRRAPYATLDDLRAMELQLKERYGDARIAVARGKGKRPMDEGYLENPLSAEDMAEWDAGVREDMADDSLPLSQRRHFVLLLNQCVPQLGVIDADEKSMRKAPAARRLGEGLRRAFESGGVWLADSPNGGWHALFVKDLAWKEIIPFAKHRVRLQESNTGAGRPSPEAGDIINYSDTAYCYVGSPAPFGDFPTAHASLSGRSYTPGERSRRATEDALGRVRALGREENARSPKYWRIAVHLGDCLGESGFRGSDPDVVSAARELASCMVDHRPACGTEGNGLDMPGVVKLVTNACDRVSGARGAATGAASKDLAYLYESTRDYIEVECGGREGYVIKPGATADTKEILVWDDALNRWTKYYYGQQRRDGRYVREAFKEKIRKVLTSKADYLEVPRAALGNMRTHQAEVLNLLTENSDSDFETRFDYERPSFRHGDTPPDTRYYAVGDGTKVVRVSVNPDLVEKGEQVVVIPNKREYYALRCLPMPEDVVSGENAGKRFRESELFVDTLKGVWKDAPEVVDWFRKSVVETFLPRDYQEPEFLVLKGRSKNGKSVVMDAVMAAFGEFAKKVDYTHFTTKRSNDPRALAKRREMIGCLLYAVNETDGGWLDTVFIKNVAENAPVEWGGFHIENGKEPVCLDGKVMFTSNCDLPVAPDKGIERRACLVPCNRRFQSKDIDLNRSKSLRAEAHLVLGLMLNDLARDIAARHASGWGSERKRPAVVVNTTASWLARRDSVKDLLESFLLTPSEAIANYDECADADSDLPLAVPRTGDGAPGNFPLVFVGQAGENNRHSGLSAIVAQIMESEGERGKPTQVAREHLANTGSGNTPFMTVKGIGAVKKYAPEVPTYALVSFLLQREVDDEGGKVRATDLFLRMFRPADVPRAIEVYAEGYNRAALLASAAYDIEADKLESAGNPSGKSTWSESTGDVTDDDTADLYQ